MNNKMKILRLLAIFTVLAVLSGCVTVPPGGKSHTQEVIFKGEKGNAYDYLVQIHRANRNPEYLQYQKEMTAKYLKDDFDLSNLTFATPLNVSAEEVASLFRDLNQQYAGTAFTQVDIDVLSPHVAKALSKAGPYDHIEVRGKREVSTAENVGYTIGVLANLTSTYSPKPPAPAAWAMIYAHKAGEIYLDADFTMKFLSAKVDFKPIPPTNYDYLRWQFRHTADKEEQRGELILDTPIR